jgi:uncharacterized OB-fold protein
MSASHVAIEGDADRPVIEQGGESRLLGSVCTACGTHEFPVQRSCARCGSAMEPAALPTQGTVWSWTVQRTRPKRLKGSEPFEPFAVGYVDLGPLKVATRLGGKPVDQWRIGERVTLSVPSAPTTELPPYWFSSAVEESR